MSDLRTDGAPDAAVPGRDGAVQDAASSSAPRPRVAPVVVLAVTVVIAAFFVILIRAKTESGETAYSPLIDKPAPAVQTTTLDGKPFDLQRRKGSWVVLNFFDAKCVPCVQEHPDLVKFAEQQQAPAALGAELYTVVWNDVGGETSAFFDENPVSWPVLVDENAEISGEFAVTKVPETWIIDPNGYVVWRTISVVTDNYLTSELNKLVARYQGAIGVG